MSMRRTLRLLAVSLVWVGLAVPVYGYQGAAPNPDDTAYAELEQALADLKKAVELDPDDTSVRYYMVQIYNTQFGILLRKLTGLMRADKGNTDEARRILAELERIGEEVERLLHELPKGPMPTPRPGSPCDTPIPKLEPSQDGPAQTSAASSVARAF